ncbi:MAG: hypothetical protein GEU86_02690 [Actinophytocola sp.]|nr:hypothetical protein [Actinophytocola sp.]
MMEQRPGDEPDPAETDAEQFRQFQEFQRFQEFQQSQRGQDLVPRQPGELEQPPSDEAESTELTGPLRRERRRPPAWLVGLGGKLLTAFLVLIAAIIGVAWAINHFLGGGDAISNEELAGQGGKKAEATVLYASDPYAAVRRVYARIAQPDPETGKPQVGKVCLRFDDAAREQFARNFGHGKCSAAVIALHAEVSHVTRYVQSLPRSVPIDEYDEVAALAPGESFTVDSCAVATGPAGISDGPALGTFTVTKLARAKGQQWLITGHEAGPRTCPAPTTTG